jgi:hypothetical protein
MLPYRDSYCVYSKVSSANLLHLYKLEAVVEAR